MTDEATLRALIVQAVDNGFDHPLYLSIIDRMMNDGDHPPIAVLGILLMHHDFTMAAWGEADEDCRCVGCGTTYKHEAYCPYSDRPDTRWRKAYKYHPQQIVISDDPFGYVRETL